MLILSGLLLELLLLLGRQVAVVNGWGLVVVVWVGLVRVIIVLGMMMLGVEIRRVIVHEKSEFELIGEEFII